MARIKVDLPDSFSFQTEIPIRITDVNYGGHVGNDTVLSLIHEARVQYLAQFGYEELKIAGIGLIMSDAGIEYKAELFYGDKIKVSVALGELSKIGFDLFYKIEKQNDDKSILVAAAKTGMICYDYARKKIAPLPDEARAKLTAS
jgi:acyl-CoA thioester hydrolase